MNSDDLQLFAQVAAAGSFARAAIAQGSDPSTLSRRVGQLEQALGVRLLHRSGRGVSPTAQGRQLLAYAEAVAELLRKADAELRALSDAGPARLEIGAQPTIARILFGPLAQRLAADYPQTRLRLVEALGSQLLEQLAAGALDFALLYLPETSGTLQFDPLLSEGLHLVAPPEAGPRGDAIELRRLGAVPLILPSTHHGIRRLVDALGARHGFVPRIAFECDGSISLTKRLVMQGCGCTVLPLAAVREELERGRLRSLRLAGAEVRRTVGLVAGRNRTAPAGLWRITRIVKQAATALVREGAWPDALVVEAAPPGATGVG